MEFFVLQQFQDLILDLTNNDNVLEYPFFRMDMFCYE